jgi:GR25 family glycosyltransferase involved in LPS biosynthesis
MSYKIFVINLKKREDRKKNVESIFQNINFEEYSFYEGIDGLYMSETLEIKELFTGNDFGNRKGFIGCAMTHYNIWINLIKDENDYYIIFEDDISLSTNFNKYFENVKNIVRDNLNKIDFLLLGYHPSVKSENNSTIKLKKLDINKYIGGFFSYIITKNGAKNIIKYIENNGIKHGIDYLLKINDELNSFELENHIVYSDWVKSNKDIVDSNIQKDYNSFDFDKIIDYNNYIFIKGYDIINNDLKYINKNINNLIFESKNDLCNGFNTLGFLKKKINLDNIQKIDYFKENNQGLYVKLDKKIHVKIICNWQNSQDLCNEWNPMSKGNYEWNSIKLTSTNNAEDIDYYIIINKPQNTDEKYVEEKTIIFQMEPYCNNSNQNWGIKTWGIWENPDPTKYLHVRTHTKYYNNCTWQLKKTYSEMNGHIEPKKFNYISTICSSKYYDPGHIKRVDFLKYIESKDENKIIIDIYGLDNKLNFKNYKGPLPKDNKDPGILPYKYYFMAENNSEYNYISEKFWEPIISESLCFYWGAPNINDYINPLAYVQLDLDNFDKSYKIIVDAINEDLYSKRINIIREEKYKILNYYNFFPTIERIITKDLWKKDLKNIINNTIFYIIENNNIANYLSFPLINSLKELGFTIEIIKKCNENNTMIDNIIGENFIKRIIYNKMIKYLKIDLKINISLDKNKIYYLMTKYSLYERILENKNLYKNYIILNNDNILNCSLNKLLFHILYLPENYDVCQLTESNNSKFKLINQINSYYYEVKKYFFDNSTSLILSNSGIYKILKYTNNYILDYSNNLIYECYENITDFKFYSIKNPVFI